MSRSYRNIRPKKHHVYTVEDIMQLYGVCRNSTTNWVNDGLRKSDNGVPSIFNGSELKRFHADRRTTEAVKLRLGQFKCFSCKGRVFPEPETLSRSASKAGHLSFWGACPDCGGAISKRVNETDCDKILQCIDTNTSLSSLDEGKEAVPVDTGKDRRSETQSVNKVNDRILHDWLQFAGRWDQKTISAKLATIRLFEDFCGGKAFSKLTNDDVVRFRDSLKASVETTAETPLSISTIRHRASHLKSFLEWLVEQKGYQGLNKSLPGYLALPKKFDAAGLTERDRYVPTLSEATQLIEDLPCRTLKQRRDRAMVAIAFLAALRADTVTSLRVKHLDPASRTVVQDAKSSRTKNGKSLRINFFPLPDVFSKVVCDWKEEVLGLGLSEEDALFPEERFMVRWNRPKHGKSIPVMTSTHAISSAFEMASKPLGKRVSPHCAKHCIGNLSMEACKTPEELKAWSMNMGHESEDVTLRYYKNLPEDRVDEIFEQFDLEDQTGNEVGISDMQLMLNFHEHRLHRDSPEYDRIKRLVLTRLKE